MREMALIFEAQQKRDARLAWLAAQYARYAYHQPNDMPECPGLPKKDTSKADRAYVRAWLMARAAHGR